MIKIVNLTPHSVVIIRGTVRTEFPACAPCDLPRALEENVAPDMALTDSGSDGQGGYANASALAETGLVDNIGYTGVTRLAHHEPGELMFGVGTFRIVSVVTAIGCLAKGRGVEDLLIPMGQVRDDAGRVIGATSLAPAAALLTPMYKAIVAPYAAEILRALQERNAARS